MPSGEFEGRTAAEAAIKACDAWGVSRSQLQFEVLSDAGEGLDRVVRITAKADEGAKAPAADNDSPAPRRREGGSDRGDRGDRGGRSERGGRGGRDRGDRGGDRNDRGRHRGRRAGRSRGPSESRGHGGIPGENDAGIESLLNLEAVPADPGEMRPVLEGDCSAKASQGHEMLLEIVQRGGFDLKPFLVQDDAEEIHFDLRGPDEARIIGRKGDALLALQFLLNRMAGREAENEPVLVLDAANYRARRRDALAELARRLAKRAVEEGKAVRLSPMSAHDRRVFHMTLKEIDDVDTRSEGDGLYRNLLIIPDQMG